MPNAGETTLRPILWPRPVATSASRTIGCAVPSPPRGCAKAPPSADLATAVKLGAQALKLDARKLRTAAQSKRVRDRVAATTAEFHAHRINQRPAFIATDAIGDKAVFAGLVKYEPLAAALDAMLDDCAGYTSFAAHHGPVPQF